MCHAPRGSDQGGTSKVVVRMVLLAARLLLRLLLECLVSAVSRSRKEVTDIYSWKESLTRLTVSISDPELTEGEDGRGRRQAAGSTMSGGSECLQSRPEWMPVRKGT